MLEKAVALDFKKHLAQKVGTRSKAVWTQASRQVCPSRCPKSQNLWHFSGFRKRGLANGVSPFFSENETVKHGRKRKKTEENGKKTNGRKRKETEENGKKTRKKSEATPFRRPLLRKFPRISRFGKIFSAFFPEFLRRVRA